MRELKFRIWDTSIKRWIRTQDNDSVCSGAWGVFCYLQDRFENKTSSEVIQQYTGLKDKNGKEIYEGDIIRNPDNQKEITIVEWGEKEGCWENTVFAMRPIFSWWEIIGNIFENPELFPTLTLEDVSKIDSIVKVQPMKNGTVYNYNGSLIISHGGYWIYKDVKYANLDDIVK